MYLGRKIRKQVDDHHLRVQPQKTESFPTCKQYEIEPKLSNKVPRNYILAWNQDNLENNFHVPGILILLVDLTR